MKKLFLRGAAGICFIVLFAGWGADGHKIINSHITASFPVEMSYFKSWNDGLTSHASDADNRKSSDKTESPKHFIDIDYYPVFVNTHRIPETLDSMNAAYGASTVLAQGILPFAIITTVDSLRAAFLRKDFNRAMLVAADLGHYIGDAHQPLHVTDNYDGAQTGQSGVHSRYETSMVGAYKDSIIYSCSPAIYITDVQALAFNAVYHTYDYVDSVLAADANAKKALGTTSGSAYTKYMWNATGQFTTMLMQDASWQVASLIYTAWKDAGSPQATTGIQVTPVSVQKNFSVSAYPNPFNNQVTFTYSVPERAAGENLSLVIYSITGKEVDRIADINRTGKNSVRYTADKLASGTYIASIRSGKDILSSVKFVLMK